MSEKKCNFAVRNIMLSIFKIRKSERGVAMVAAILFAVLVGVMIAFATGYGNVDVSQRGVVLSGFDNNIYPSLRSWTVRFELLRHPLMSPLLWPLSVLDGWLMAWTGHECNVYIVGVLWWLMDCYTFMFVYRFLHDIIRLKKFDATLMTLLFFSLGYVMMAAVYPDHMTVTMFLLSLTMLVMGQEIRSGRAVAVWKKLLLFLLCTGVTTTNCAKVLLADFVAFVNKETHIIKGADPLMMRLFRRYVWFLIPVVILFGAYYAQKEYIVKPRVVAKWKANQAKIAKGSKEAGSIKARNQRVMDAKKKQVMKGKLFQFTDVTVERIPSAWHNAFGEGLQLHSDHRLQDFYARDNTKRPLFVEYGSWVQYMVEILLLLLLLCGIALGIRDRAMWIPLSWFLFDMVIHLGFNFAINDVYIMTAHWAFIFPVAYAYLLKRMEHSHRLYLVARASLTLLTLYLIAYNSYQYVIYCVG